MMGSVSGALEQFPQLAPSLAPENNVVMDYGLRLYRSDIAITVAALLNLSALAVLAGMLVLPSSPERMRAPSKAPTFYRPVYVRQ